MVAAWVVIYGLSAGAYRLVMHKTWGGAFQVGAIAMASGIIAPFLARFIERRRGRSR